MQVTRIKIRPFSKGSPHGACEVVLDDMFIVRDILIQDGAKGYFVTYPKRTYTGGSSTDVAHPVNREFAADLSNIIIKAYKDWEESGQSEFVLRSMVARSNV
jgi:DNA-binding cell septation regulator SpoVG